MSTHHVPPVCTISFCLAGRLYTPRVPKQDSEQSGDSPMLQSCFRPAPGLSGPALPLRTVKTNAVAILGLSPTGHVVDANLARTPVVVCIWYVFESRLSIPRAHGLGAGNQLSACLPSPRFPADRMLFSPFRRNLNFAEGHRLFFTVHGPILCYLHVLQVQIRGL